MAPLNLPVVRKDGGEIIIEMSLSPIDPAGGTAVGSRFVQVNRSLCEMLGYSEGELVATTFLKITYPDDVDVSMAHVRRVLEGEIDSYSLEKRYVGADGRPVWVSLSVSLVRDAVRANSQGMGLLIDDLLSLSRVTRSEILRTTVDLSALAESVVDELRQGDPERQVQVEIASGMVVTGDAGLLRAALEKLLGNAWKFTSKEPHARIEFGSTSYDGAYAYFVRETVRAWTWPTRASSSVPSSGCTKLTSSRELG
jgi:PAS domain S-box-containing protein